MVTDNHTHKTAPRHFRDLKNVHVLILFENIAAYECAKDICWQNFMQLAYDLDLVFSSWNFSDLTHPQRAQEALRTAAHSDIILVSLHEAVMPDHVRAWFDLLADHRGQRHGLLALVLDEATRTTPAAAALHKRMALIADKLDIDFLSMHLLPTKNTSSTMATHSLVGEQDYDHWGLNE